MRGSPPTLSQGSSLPTPVGGSSFLTWRLQTLPLKNPEEVGSEPNALSTVFTVGAFGATSTRRACLSYGEAATKSLSGDTDGREGKTDTVEPHGEIEWRHRTCHCILNDIRLPPPFLPRE